MGIHRRSFGKFDLYIPEIGLGTSQIGNTDYHSRGVKFIPPEEAEKILALSLKGGINFFDTAPNYGNAQKHIRNVLNSHPSFIEGLVVASKAGLKLDGTRKFSRSFLLSELEESLNNLEQECLDLFQLNKPSLKDIKEGELFSFLDELKAEGKVKYTGLIVGEIKTGYEAIKSGKVDCLQVLYNILYQDTEDLIFQAAKKGLGIIVRSPLNSGLLTGTYSIDQKFDDNDDRKIFFSGSEFAKRLEVVDEIQKTIGISDEQLLEFSLSFILSNPYVSSVIPAASTVSQMRRFVEFDQSYFLYTLEEWEKIKKKILCLIKPINQKFQSDS